MVYFSKTSVLYANVVNVTETHGSHIVPKLQLFLEEKPRGLGGRWQWYDTTLHFEKGEWTNHGAPNQSPLQSVDSKSVS